MQPPELPDPAADATPAHIPGSAPDFSSTPQPIAQWTQRPDFPKCALGVHVSIHGFEGVVVEIIGHSLKVVSREGIRQRFNGLRLKTIFAPAERPRSVPSAPVAAPPAPAAPPPRVFIANPDFSAPVRAIRSCASQPDFPECSYGQHVEIQGYTGVVVELVKGSLKVQSRAGITRTYNCAILKKLYGRA